jgi:hypothetical protein
MTKDTVTLFVLTALIESIIFALSTFGVSETVDFLQEQPRGASAEAQFFSWT